MPSKKIKITKEELEQNRIDDLIREKEEEREKEREIELEKIEEFKKRKEEWKKNELRKKQEMEEMKKNEQKKMELLEQKRINVEERLEKERLEKERLEKERLEKERLEKERLENDALINIGNTGANLRSIRSERIKERKRIIKNNIHNMHIIFSLEDMICNMNHQPIYMLLLSDTIRCIINNLKEELYINVGPLESLYEYVYCVPQKNNKQKIDYIESVARFLIEQRNDKLSSILDLNLHSFE